MPGVLLRALNEYKFVGTPLWRMSDRKDLVRVELTFHKALPIKPYYKRRTESRRQPAPSARSSFKTATTPRTDADREGDATTNDTDHTTDHQNMLQGYS